MTDRAAIIAAFEQREREAGGPFLADHAAIREEVARDLGVPSEDVRSVMISHWVTGAAG